MSVFSPGQGVCREEGGAVVGERCRGRLGLQTCVSSGTFIIAKAPPIRLA